MRSRLPLLLAPLLALIWSCAQAPPPPVTGPTRSVTLLDGSSLEVPERALRVLPVTSSALDLLVELCDLDRIAAIPGPARYWSVVADDPERYAGLEVMERLTGEQLLAAGPDLIIASPWTERGPLMAASEAGIPVVELPDTETWEDLVAGIEFLGRVLDESARAEALLEGLEQRRATLGSVDRLPLRVMPYANFGQGGSTSGARTTLDLVIRLAGLKNAAAGADLARHAQVSLEQVLLIDPEVFLTASSRDGVAAGASYLRGEGALGGMRAVREDRIVVLPAELFSTSSHRVLIAAELLAAAVDEMFEE